MRCVIVLSGEIRDDAAALTWLGNAGRIICADGGARHLHRLEVRPHLLIGDMDSIDDEDRYWLDSLQVPVRQFPIAKDATDSELALELCLTDLPLPAAQHEIVILAAFGDRPDHVLANQIMAASLAKAGWRIIMTDGISTLYTLFSGQTLNIEFPVPSLGNLALSAIPVTESVSGITYRSGLLYPLDKAELAFGSTRGVSNQIINSPVNISIDKGILLVIVTPS